MTNGEGMVALRIREGRATEDDLVAFAKLNPTLRVELSEDGELIVSPPPGSWSARDGGEIFAQIWAWCRRTRYGDVFPGDAMFRLPNGSLRSPDVSVVRMERFAALTHAQKRGFAPLCPEIVVEVRSPSDYWPDLLEKLAMFRSQGALVTLGFDPAGPVEIVDADGLRTLERPNSVTLRVPGVDEPLVLELRELYEPD